MEDKSDMIYDLLKTERKEANEFRKEVRETHVNIVERLAKIEALDEVQNSQLEEHIRRTNLLENLHRQNEERISKLEEPAKARKTINKWILGLGALATAIAAVIGLIKIF